MEEFSVVQTLRGAIYGKVALVKHRRTDKLYAMKLMSIPHMSAKRAVTGPRVREDGSTELRILRRLSGNRVFEVTLPSPRHCASGGDIDIDSGMSAPLPLERQTNSVNPLWEQGVHQMNSPAEHHHILLLHTDFLDLQTNARCLVFDFCPYGELYDQLQFSSTRALGMETARGFFVQIATAVQYIHGLNIAHRDLSLENVLVDEYKQCRLADFGLASEYGSVCAGRVGKAFYMAPEVFTIQPNETYNGLKADIWSLGVLLFIMATGVPPFEVPSDSDARFRLVKSKGINELMCIWQLENKVSHELRDLLAHMLRMDPSERLTIEEVCAHEWLQDRIDDQILEQEGKFAEGMVQMMCKQREHSSPREPHEVVDNTDPVQPPPTPVVTKVQRVRKRMKIMIDDGVLPRSALLGGDDDEEATLLALAEPPVLKHESPCGNGDSNDLVQPRASPMVWPRVGIRTALRSLFGSCRSGDMDGEMETNSDLDDEEKEDGKDPLPEKVPAAMTPARRRRRTSSSSSSSCSSDSRVRSGSDAAGNKATLVNIVRRGTLMCRFCLQWVSEEKCCNHVTLPTKLPWGREDNRKTKTRRVCDECFHQITQSDGNASRHTSAGDSAAVLATNQVPRVA